MLSAEFESGLTVMEVTAFHSDSQRSMIYFVVNRFQIGKMKDIVHKCDSSAFIKISEVADIYSAERK